MWSTCGRQVVVTADGQSGEKWPGRDHSRGVREQGGRTTSSEALWPQRVCNHRAIPASESMEEVWVEKYRPASLGDVVGQADVVERLKAYVRAKSMPHLLFAGPAGTGKTTCAIALARELFGEHWRENFHELNASDERGIEVVRVKIKEFARTAPLGAADFKIIFLDEADALTDDAQSALRRTMERYTLTCRFILSVNYSSKIIDPIQSRCAVFRFRPLKEEEVTSYLSRIAKGEGLKVEKSGTEAILHLSGGDLRRATNALQVAATLGKKIDDETVYQTASAARPEEIKKLLDSALAGDFTGARDRLDKLLIDHGLAGEDLIRQIHRGIFDLAVPDDLKVALIDRAGEVEFRLVEGSNDRIQLEALLAQFALLGGKGKKR